MTTARAPVAPAATRRRARSYAAAVLCLALAFTGIATWATRREVSDLRQRRFDGLVVEAGAELEREFGSYTEILFGLRGLFVVNGEVTRRMFHDYLDQSDALARLSGARVVSFDRALPAAEAPAHEERVRRDTSLNGGGYPDYAIHPPAGEDDLLVIEYIEPTPGHEQILGTNILSDPVRRAAVEEARDSGALVATAPVELLSGGRGFVLYLAVYDTPSPPVTTPARRRHFRGTVAAVFNAEGMIDDVIETVPGIDLAIYDVGLTVDAPRAAPGGDDLVFGEDDDARFPLRGYDRASLRGAHDLNVASRRWRLYASAASSFNVNNDRALVWVVLIGGGALSLLLAGLVTALGRSRRLALTYAEEMTADLAERERELEATNALLGEANERLQEADTARTAFLSVVSHELQTPLVSITGLSHLLQPRTADEETADLVHRIARNAQTLSVVVEQLVDFTRLERDAMRLHLQPVDLGQLVALAIEQLDPLLADRPIGLDLEDHVTVEADAEAVTRILNNLVSNALKFSPAGSPVEVRVASRDGVGELHIADRGPGIPDADRPHVFDAFFRGSAEQAAGTPGTGVGLAVVKELVELMGGSVTAANRTDGGAHLAVTLPRSGIPSP